ncbi:hypothetical protein [Aurantiacibacter gangjinensis]|uniref:Uncharacterized protein n=1 Tax=Aurantiacibacter gangjinensis TaxID=502682 RepID=A0A0G9MMX1_9SPHN|nr:hypothetical protein [Aurantiacibacter gangjinensis]APE28142.1 hypothetical protein BMF35_a1313 [Aurantiacibacter gangjinensis]KLE32057.1 hypothetical protein AAW01_11595 [Aurantiacibacter gangjinensis]
MDQLLQENWILVVAALLIGIVVAYWIFVASRRTKVEADETATDDAGTARRNQALIDAPPAARKDDLERPSAPTAGADPAFTHDHQQEKIADTATAPGELSASANTAQVAASPLGTDAETGDGVPMREAMKATQDVPAPPPPASPATGDDLGRIKGVGPKLVAILREQGVNSFSQIAEWDDADIDRVDAKLGRFQGRIRRDNWVEQARLLSADDITAYEAKFGRTS